MSRTFLVGLVGLFAIVAPAPAAVVVIGNASTEPVAFTLTTLAGAVQKGELKSGETRAYACGKRIDIRYVVGEKAVDFQLEGYGAYAFAGKGERLSFGGIELLGKPVPLDDVPAEPAAAETLSIPVALFADDAERRTRLVWERTFRQRLAEASAVLAAHVPVKFEVAGAQEWETDPTAVDMDTLYRGFTRAAKAESGKFALGYTSRLQAVKFAPGMTEPFGVAKPAWQPHVLLREGEPRNEAERVEVLAHYLGRQLGAVACPDATSVMRPRLGDGKATSARFHIGFDPLNTLAMNIWVEQLRGGKVAKWSDLSAPAQARLGRVYATLSKALPDEPVPEEYAAMMVKAGVRNVEPKPEEPEPRRAEAPVPAKPAATDKEAATRKVVRAIAVVADDNAKEKRLRGDELTTLYIRTAADIARFEDKEVRVAAFLVGLGIGLDDSNILRGNPLARDFCRKVETDEERAKRIAVLGTPTIAKRRDLCQHFAVSAALVELVGPALAEQAGLAKELIDMTKASGFSFTDLAADYAGVAFANHLKAKPERLDRLHERFVLADYMPKLDGLRDGLPKARFAADYGDVGDDRFTKEYDALKARVTGLKVYETAEK